MTEGERRSLREKFTPSCLLDALNDCDALRASFVEAAASLERIQRTVAKLADLYPESLLKEEARASA